VIAKIIDLGLAKAVNDSGAQTAISTPGAFAGIPSRYIRSCSLASTESITKVNYLAIRNITKKWQKLTWKQAATQFAIQFGERFFAADVA
jgi:hypothetical protein